MCLTSKYIHIWSKRMWDYVPNHLHSHTYHSDPCAPGLCFLMLSISKSAWSVSSFATHGPLFPQAPTGSFAGTSNRGLVANDFFHLTSGRCIASRSSGQGAPLFLFKCARGAPERKRERKRVRKLAF